MSDSSASVEPVSGTEGTAGVTKAVTHNGKIVVTSYFRAPVPTDRFDWSAYYDGEEERGRYGYGRTEQEAIADFNSASQLNPKLFLAQKGIGDSYFKLKEQEIRNLVWISECILQKRKDQINNFIPLFSSNSEWRCDTTRKAGAH